MALRAARSLPQRVTRQQQPPDDNSKRRRRIIPEHLILLLPIVAAVSWFAAQILYFVTHRFDSHIHHSSAVGSTTSTPRMLLVTAAPRCPLTHGQFFLTKAVQSKVAFARRHGWPLITLGGGELSAAASSAFLQPHSDDPSSVIDAAAQWPGMLHQILSTKLRERGASSSSSSDSSGGEEWIVWMDAETLLLRGEAFEWRANEYDAADLVLIRADWSTAAVVRHAEGITADDDPTTTSTATAAAAALPPIDLSLAFVRVSDSSLQLLSAWAEAIATSSGGFNSTDVLATSSLSELLASAEGRPFVNRVKVVSDLESARWLGGLTAVPVRTLLPSSRSSSAGSSSSKALDERLPWLASFRGCHLCAPSSSTSSREGEDDPAAASSSSPPFHDEEREDPIRCRRTLMRAFTATDDAGPLQRLGAHHATPGSIHVHPSDRDGWLQHHRGGLGRCLPGLLIVGAQRSGLGSLHYTLRKGWHSRIRVNEGGDRDAHFFSMDNRFKLGLLSHERRFSKNSTARFGCGWQSQPEDGLFVEVSSSYFDYPKASQRIASVLPASKIVIVLREPISRAMSAYNFRWLTWLCGKLVWSKGDCWASLKSEDDIKSNQVGPFQMRAALKLFRSCSRTKADGDGGVLSLKCLQSDYTSKLRNKTSSELKALNDCYQRAEKAGTPASVDWLSCLRLRSVMLGPKQIHKVMEDSSFIFRSMYNVHLRSWLRLYLPEQMMVVDPEQLLHPVHSAIGMRALARFAGVRGGEMGAGYIHDDPRIHDEVLTSPSPGAIELGEEEGVHENARRYLLGGRRSYGATPPPADVAKSVSEYLRPHNCDLAGLLLRHGLLMTTGGSPVAALWWLRQALESGESSWGRGLEGAGSGVCAGVNSVDEWFVGAS